jgi:hypothetical protein
VGGVLPGPCAAVFGSGGPNGGGSGPSPPAKKSHRISMICMSDPSDVLGDPDPRTPGRAGSVRPWVLLLLDSATFTVDNHITSVTSNAPPIPGRENEEDGSCAKQYGFLLTRYPVVNVAMRWNRDLTGDELWHPFVFCSFTMDSTLSGGEMLYNIMLR